MKKTSVKGYNLLSSEELINIKHILADHEDLQIYTDASTFPNPGITGAALVIFSGNEELYHIKFAWPYSTNNRGELFSLIIGKQIINYMPFKNILVYSDSKYSIGCINGRGGANKDLLEKAASIASIGEKVRKVKAHTGNQDLISLGNDRADSLANEARLSLESELHKNKKTISEKQQSETIGELESTIIDLVEKNKYLESRLAIKCPKVDELIKYKQLLNKLTSSNYMSDTELYKVNKFKKELGL